MMPGSSSTSSTPVTGNPVPPVNSFLRFLQELDQALIPYANGQRLDLYHLGRSALVWRYQATFSTKDIDIVKLRTPLEEKAHELFGKNSAKAKELNLYLDLVPQGIPPLPAGFQGRSTEVFGGWQVIRLWELEPHDLAATKLKVFRPQDREDLRFLCDQGILRADKLHESLTKAFLWHPEDDDDRDRALAHLQIVINYLQGQSATL